MGALTNHPEPNQACLCMWGGGEQQTHAHQFSERKMPFAFWLASPHGENCAVFCTVTCASQRVAQSTNSPRDSVPPHQSNQRPVLELNKV